MLPDKDEQPTTPSDVFDRLGSLRLRQSFDKMKTKKPLATVGIRKPKPNEWCYAHPEHRYEGLLFLEREGMSDEWFFPTNEEVVAELEALSVTGLRQVCIFWWINRKKNTFIWPVQLADSDGRQNDWHASMYEMMTVHANGQWCRIEAGDGGYNPEIAENSSDDPSPSGRRSSTSARCCGSRSRRGALSTTWTTPCSAACGRCCSAAAAIYGDCRLGLRVPASTPTTGNPRSALPSSNCARVGASSCGASSARNPRSRPRRIGCG